MKLDQTQKTNLVVFRASLLAIMLLVGFSLGQAFAESKDKVVLCHIGDSGPETINVPENAEKAHLAHGDTLGECKDVKDNGNGTDKTSSGPQSTDKVTICHIPPGNPSNAHTITIGASAVAAHQAHGDYVKGSCESANLDLSDKKQNSENQLSVADKVTICHIPPGNPSNAHTITIGGSAVKAHLAHGDVKGPCDLVELPEPNDSKVKRESRLSEAPSQKEEMTLKRAQKLIEQLEQKVANQEKRLQTLIEKYESGEYYGNVSNRDPVTKTYPVSLDGMATSIFDETIQVKMTGKLYLENLVTNSNTSKFKVISGEIIIGDNLYDVAFGKARVSSIGEEDSMVVILQTIDSQDNKNTIKLALDFDSLKGEDFGDKPEEFKILNNSKISGQWNLNGTGQMSFI